MTAESGSATFATDQTGLSRSEGSLATGQPDERLPSQSLLHADCEVSMMCDLQHRKFPV